MKLLHRTLFLDEVRDLDETTRSATFVASTERAVPVMGGLEVLRMKGADLTRYKKNPVLLDTHRRDSICDIIGKADATIDHKARKLMARVSYADTEAGLNAWKLVKGGFVKAMSIGYGVDESQVRRLREGEIDGEGDAAITGPADIVNRWELHEISNVPVPADEDAVRSAFYDSLTKKGKKMARNKDGRSPFARAMASETRGKRAGIPAEAENFPMDPTVLQAAMDYLETEKGYTQDDFDAMTPDETVALCEELNPGYLASLNEEDAESERAGPSSERGRPMAGDTGWFESDEVPEDQFEDAKAYAIANYPTGVGYSSEELAAFEAGVNDLGWHEGIEYWEITGAGADAADEVGDGEDRARAAGLPPSWADEGGNWNPDDEGWAEISKKVIEDTGATGDDQALLEEWLGAEDPMQYTGYEDVLAAAEAKIGANTQFEDRQEGNQMTKEEKIKAIRAKIAKARADKAKRTNQPKPTPQVRELPAEASARVREAFKREVMSICPRGLESVAENLILRGGLDVEQIRKHLIMAQAKKRQPIGTPEATRRASGSALKDVSDEDIVRSFGNL